MNVKPEIFQVTKQTILKNKYEFIEIQLKEGAKRINALKAQNTQLKAQIKQLKSKNNKTQPNKISLTTREIGENKENKCLNLAKKRNKDIEIVTDRLDDANEENQDEQLEDELKELQMKFAEQERDREKQVLYLEDYIKMLKKVWISKQNKGENQAQEESIATTVRIRDLKEAKRTEKLYNAQPESKKTFFDSKPDNMIVSRQSLNQSQIGSEQKNKMAYMSILNTSNYMETSQSASSNLNTSIEKSNQSKRFVVEPRRKTMSVNLNNSTGHLMGFNFGKKSINKAKHSQKSEASRFNTSQMNDKQPIMGNEPTNSSNSMLSHSNSRNSMSMFSNAGSKSQFKRTQSSKSYGKIVTKLKCKGCSVEFRPNEYYRHIEQCRDFLKITLLEQKMRVEDEINQTLNLSLQENHY